MEERQFNLVDEPWIPIVDREMRHRRVSLREALLCADRLLAIDGETPLQSTALLRLLLAIVITILVRFDENGREAELEEPPQAKHRWLAVYRLGRLPEAAVNAYLDQWHDRFWLLGGEYPLFPGTAGGSPFHRKGGDQAGRPDAGPAAGRRRAGEYPGF